MQEIYSALPKVVVENFAIHESQLNTKRMLDLMDAGDSPPLYMHTITRILRNMRLEQQDSHEQGFDYADFKARLVDENLLGSQRVPLQQRLDALESFMPSQQEAQSRMVAEKGRDGRKATKRSISKTTQSSDETWRPKVRHSHDGPHYANSSMQAGELTIVDLSCPCITDLLACSLFNICLSLFLEQSSGDIGRVVALDEAHKYMKDSAECRILTESLLTSIRLQRHLAVRVFISTQEPTVSPKLLDLCPVSILHHFSSPDWLKTIVLHLAGASNGNSNTEGNEGTSWHPEALMRKITDLRTGEALLFAPTATVGVRLPPAATHGYDEEGEYASDDFSDKSSASSSAVIHLTAPRSGPPMFQRLVGMLKVNVRKRVTEDGGKSILS